MRLLMCYIIFYNGFCKGIDGVLIGHDSDRKPFFSCPLGGYWPDAGNGGLQNPVFDLLVPADLNEITHRGGTRKGNQVYSFAMEHLPQCAPTVVRFCGEVCLNLIH